MKILIVNTVPFNRNGISSVIINYYKELVKYDCDIDVVSISEIIEEYKTIFLKNKSRIFYLINRKSNILSYCKELYHLLKKEHYDIIHVHGNSSLISFELFIAYLCGVRIRIAHAHSTKCEHNVLNSFLKPVFKKLYTNAFACSQAAGKWMFDDNPFIVIKNGIDIRKFEFDIGVRQRIRKTLNIDNDSFLIGHVGSFSEVKNHDFIIKLFYMVNKIDRGSKLVLIGDGPLLDKVKQKVKYYNLEKNVIFAGSIDNVFEYYCAMDVFLLPSLYEGLPVVLVEAQANGIISLVSNNITRSADITGHVEFLDLKNIDYWIQRLIELKEQINIEDRITESESNLSVLEKRGFDVCKNGKELYLFYLKFYRTSYER